MSIVTGEDRPREARSAIGSRVRTRVELWLAVVLMAVAFGAGIAVRSLYEPVQPTTSLTQTGLPSGQIVAPPLTDQEIQQGLPPGHPDLGESDQSSGGGNGSQDAGSKGSKDGTTASPGSP